jgi:hypothetical protein
MKFLFIKLAAIALSGIALSACAQLNDPSRVVLPLDHGPRAQTTPWENRQRHARIERNDAAIQVSPEAGAPRH